MPIVSVSDVKVVVLEGEGGPVHIASIVKDGDTLRIVIRRR